VVAGRLVHVPDEGLLVVATGADVIAAVRRPGDAVDDGPVGLQLHQRDVRHPDVQHDGLLGLGVDGGQEVGVLLVPDDAKQRREVGRLVKDRGVLQRPEVEESQRAVGAHRAEDVLPAGEGQVVHLLVVGDQLRARGHRGDIPDGAGGVDGAGAHYGGVHLVPVEARQRRAVLCMLVIVQNSKHFHIVIVVDTPQPEIVSSGGN